MAVYPPRMAPFGLKLWENAFQAIPDISFFNVEIFFETSIGRLPPEDGSNRPQTLGKRVSGNSRHFIFRRRNFFQNFERPFAPRGWLHLASNFGKTRFRWSPTFHFSTPTNIFSDNNFCRKNCSSTPRKMFQQSACFGGAVQVYTPLANADRKFIARHIGFSLLRPLAEG